MHTTRMRRGWLSLALVIGCAAGALAAEEWLQPKFDSKHSGNVPGRTIQTPLGLLGAVALGDAVLTSPVVAAGRVYVVDASGTAFCIDARTFEIVWKFATRGGAANCNNVSSPTLVDGKLHFGTMAGWYYVLDAAMGKLVREMDCGEPIFSAPVASGGRVYLATLGSQFYALEPDGKVCWKWDYVGEVLKFPGNRWSAGDWLAHKKGRVNWRDQFCCPIDIVAEGRRIVAAPGGRMLWLQDAGDHAAMQCLTNVPSFAGNEYPGVFGLSLGEDGAAYVQWHRRDNSGRTEVIALKDGKPQTNHVHGTETAIYLQGLLSFSSVSLRGTDVFRCKPEQGLGCCLHKPGEQKPTVLGADGAIAPPILLKDSAVYGGLDGRLRVVSLDGKGKGWLFATAFGRAISAPAAVADGRVYFGCEDGYLYALGPDGKAPLPTKDLGLHRIRSPLSGRRTGAEHDWFTNYGDLANSNANDQRLKTPLHLKWVRRYEGTFKHVPVCGGGRLYTHTAEGQLIAVEQETGRLLWRTWFPHVYMSFTAPLYANERLLLPQAGMKQSRLRCLDAATGKMRWEAPFSGSPSWSRQGPPVVFKNAVIYGFGSGRYAAQGTAKPFIFRGTPEPSPDGAEVMSWVYTHDNPYYPKDNKPLLRAWGMETGKELWTKDFSEIGSGGNDCGVCLMDGTVYYSTFFGYAAQRNGQPGARGLTAALDPLTGAVRWQTTNHFVTAGCSISGKDGRLYLGGYNQPHGGTKTRHVWCLDARDGKLVWESEPVLSAVNVITVGDKFIFSNASNRDGHLLDKATGKIVSRFSYGYACTRFTVAGAFALGANMDLIDLTDGNKLVSTGPPLEPRECVGSIVSNGRLFYTAQASGLQACQVGDDEADAVPPVWKKKSKE